MYFDTHVHLNSERYENIDLIIENALKNNVTRMIVVGYDLQTSKKAVDIANKYDFIYASVGIHPSEIKNIKENDLEEIEALLSNKKVVGIGEIGLDYYWDKDNKKEQKEMFIKQIKLAHKYNLPIVIHSRDAAEDTYLVLKENKEYYTKGIMHCYSYSLELAKEFVNLGFYLSFGGPITFLNAKQNKEVVKNIDIKNILIETDAPYLTPHPFRGKLNEPKYVELVAKEIAILKEMPYEEVATFTYENACKLFGVEP